jgi:hypothetical protein
MWHAEHTLETTARPERVWEQMQRVDSWPQWDTGLAWAELSGDFSAGAQGTMKFRSEGPRTFRLCAVRPNHGFTALMKLPLAEVRHIHHQEITPMGTRMTHRIEMRGPLAWLYWWSMGRRLREGLAPGMRQLARLAS